MSGIVVVYRDRTLRGPIEIAVDRPKYRAFAGFHTNRPMARTRVPALFLLLEARVTGPLDALGVTV